MPTYLYFCKKHGEFEEFHSIKEKLKFCPKCEEEGIKPPNEVERLIAPGTMFILNGSGWAKDNYH